MDCNSFYCSCERVFRPELNNKPVIVLSNNDGCAIALTKEAKALGVKMGDPYFKIKYLCEKKAISIFSSNFSLYTNISERVMGTLIKNCPDVEIYSIDEAFIDFTGIAESEKIARDLRAKILKNVGIPVGIGIAPTKVLSKIANHLAKNSDKANGVVDLKDERLIDIALKRVSVSKIWGVGRQSTLKLNDLGIFSAYDFKEYKNERQIKKIFTKVGLQIKEELRGINCFQFGHETVNKKEIMCSRTFGNSVYDKEVLKESIANYISNAAQKMRGQDSLCTKISVFARTNPFKNVAQYYLYREEKLLNPTRDTRKLIKTAYKLIDQSYQEGYEYKKAGVRLAGFYSSHEFQVDFLSDSDSPEAIELMNVIDRINYREGEGAVKFAACGVSDEAWKMNRAFKSPRYLSSWNELKGFK